MGNTANKTEFPPLWEAGIHSKTIDELRHECVDSFENAEWRRSLFVQLEKVIECLTSLNFPIEIWVDGSFTTLKPKPDDIDIVLKLEGDKIESMEDNRFMNFERTLTTIKSTLDGIHLFKLFVFPTNHPSYQIGEQSSVYWQKMWGLSRSQKPKGFALVKIDGVW